jgi:hypothetical protein
MIVYKVFYKNYEFKRGELMGALMERRKNLRGKTKVETGLRWAKLTFGQMVKDKHAIFVVPDELNLKNSTLVPIEKIIFTKEEFWRMMRGLDQEIKRKGEEVHNTVFSV